MVWLGRRGTDSYLANMAISILFVGAFGLAAFLFIQSNANSEDFFSRFYAAEVSTMAEVVNAGYGDVYLRYDNIKKTPTFRYDLADGVVSVGTDADDPVDQRTRYYGKSNDYKKDFVLRNPQFIILRKTGTAFGITNAASQLSECEIPSTKLVPLSDAKIYTNVQGDLSMNEREATERELRQTLSTSNFVLVSTPDEATVILDITVNKATQSSISAQPSSKDGRAITCLFEQDLESLSLQNIQTLLPSTTSQPTLNLYLTIAKDDLLRPSHVGLALGTALGRYYR